MLATLDEVDLERELCSLTFHRPDEPLKDRDAAMFPNGAKPWLDRPATAPGLEAIAPELPSLVTDEVLRRCARESDGSVEKRLDVVRGREIIEDGKTQCWRGPACILAAQQSDGSSRSHLLHRHQ